MVSISSLEAQGQAAAHTRSKHSNSVNSAYVWNQFESDRVPISVCGETISRYSVCVVASSGSVASTGTCTEKKRRNGKTSPEMREARSNIGVWLEIDKGSNGNLELLSTRLLTKWLRLC